MKPCVFTGSAVAIVTPFCGDGVDLEAFDRLIERQIQGGTDAIVVCGTTGEAATLSYNERMALIERCVRTVDRRVPVIAGSGTNSTASSIALSKAAQSAGVDALLTVTPYYNKASQSGLVQHFSAIADAVDIPVILYNVPSRTGVGCTAQTYQALAKHPNIAGVKEASDDFDLIQDTLNLCPPGFTVWSGNDGSTAAIMALGGKGVISVAANVVPREMHELTQLCLEKPFLRGRCAPAQAARADPCAVLRGQPHPRQGRHGALGPVQRRIAAAAVPHFRASFGTALACTGTVPSRSIS